MIKSSRYNIFVPLGEPCEGASYILFNTLAGSIDLVDKGIYQVLSALVPGKRASQADIKYTHPPFSSEVVQYLDRRGYLFENDDEEDHLDMLYKQFLEFHRQNYHQLIVVIPTYHCNLQCEYCWQRLYNMDSSVITEEMVNTLFKNLTKIIDDLPQKKAELVVFGGEPLIDYQDLHKQVKSILTKSRDFGFSTKIISNGTGLAAAIDDIYQYVDLIQVTIDGPPAIQNQRRPLPGGDSFKLTHAGIDRALGHGNRINLRVNVDLVNITSLPDLAQIIDRSGWLETGLFTVHLAPVKNHKVHEPSAGQGNLLQHILSLKDQNSLMEIFNLDGFAGLKYFEGFKESGLFPLHRFFHCEAQINFFAFDLRGDVYACWDAAGIPELAVGKYSPNIMIDKSKLSTWRDRNGLQLEKCRKCKISPNCGGGCLFLSLEKYNSFSSNYCDSLLSDYKEAIEINRDWLIKHAVLGDHAVGLVVSDRVISEINLEYGLLDSKNGEYIKQ